MAGEFQCDPYAQDCPEGLHCTPMDLDGDAIDDATVCGALSGTPVESYGTCTFDAAACTDDCALGSRCQPNPEQPGTGLCVPMCDFDDEVLACADGQQCQTCAECSVGTCLQGCDPIDPQCPESMPRCLLVGEGFVCVPAPAGRSGVGDTCDFAAQCDGSLCAPAAAVGDCAGASCCTEYCDLLDGDPACTNPAHVCLSVFAPAPAPAGQEHVGYCALPSADPCLVPGACPPPGIDDTLPWCSEFNDIGCVDGGLAGYGDGMACEGGCLCAVDCEGPGAGNCPVPPTGTATPECVQEPFGPGSPTSCMLSCAGGETCPDGMTCTEQLSGAPLCVWVSPLPPEEC